jgi:putative lipoprotein
VTTLAGAVTYLVRVGLPPGSVVRVRLEDTARQDVAAALLAETEVVTTGEQVPISFTLDADLSSLDPHARPALWATIEVEGRLRFTTTTHTSLAAEDIDEVELVVDMVRETTPALGDTEWRLVELAGEAVELAGGASVPHLVLDLEESHVTGSGGVNRLTGTFVLAEDELRFGPLATTMMAGPEEAMARELAFLDALARVTGYRLSEGTLVLLAEDESVASLVC